MHFSRFFCKKCIFGALELIFAYFKKIPSSARQKTASGKKIFLKSAARVTVFREKAPDIPLPPQPILTRWGTWVDAALYYAQFLESFAGVVNAVDANEATSIRETQKLLQKNTLKANLAFIKAHFERLPSSIESLEKQGSSLVDSTEVFDRTFEEFRSVPGPIGARIREKCEYVLSRNSGYNKLRAIAAILRDGSSSSNEIDLDPSEIAMYKYAPITSVDVERTFSSLKYILSDRRQNFTFENLKMHVVIYCNKY